MSKKFIPNGDTDFVMMAESFARTIAKEPGRFRVSQGDSDLLTESVVKFRAAFQAARRGGARSPSVTMAKEIARGEAEQHIRRLANIIRVTKTIDPVSKSILNIRERTARPKQTTCPQEPPRLRFVQALHKGNGATPMHELEFRALDFGAGRPEGAVRLELFADLVPPDEPIPAHPGANHGSRPWYLRSYTKSPIILVPPIARIAMRVVYWARWADSQGNVGPFSATCVGWIEGGVQHHLPGARAMQWGNLGRNKPVPIIEPTAGQIGPANRDHTYVVAVLEAQYQSMHPQQVTVQLPAPKEQEQRQLEGPTEEAA